MLNVQRQFRRIWSTSKNRWDDGGRDNSWAGISPEPRQSYNNHHHDHQLEFFIIHQCPTAENLLCFDHPVSRIFQLSYTMQILGRSLHSGWTILYCLRYSSSLPWLYLCVCLWTPKLPHSHRPLSFIYFNRDPTLAATPLIDHIEAQTQAQATCADHAFVHISSSSNHCVFQDWDSDSEAGRGKDHWSLPVNQLRISWSAIIRLGGRIHCKIRRIYHSYKARNDAP